MEKTYKAIISDSLSGKYDPRYVIVSTETGEILDDAQGYGYKSAPKAYAAFGYKNRSPKEIQKKKKKERLIATWCKENKSFIRDLDQFAFEIQKGSWGPDDKIDTRFVKSMLEEYGYTNLPFTAKELLQYWKRH